MSIETVFEGMACTDCALIIANGDASGMSEDDYAAWCERVEYVALGEHFNGDVVVTCDGDDCDALYTSPCDHCDERAHGARHAIVVLSESRYGQFSH